jgi:hypothetical protein
MISKRRASGKRKWIFVLKKFIVFCGVFLGNDIV